MILNLGGGKSLSQSNWSNTGLKSSMARNTGEPVKKLA